jgi:peptide/nickel transport system substrate-binding protein
MTVVTVRTGLIGGILGIAAVLAVLGSHAAPAEDSGAPVQGGSLTWGVETEPTTLNPHLNGQAKAKLLLRNIFESLLARTADGGYVPWLATGYAVSDDGKIYSFTLRDDVTFSDGRKLDAAAVVTNVTKVKDPAYSAAISTGPISHIAEARAVDARTVELTLKDAYAPFLDYIAALEIISPAAFASPKLKAGGPEVAGTGPFILDRYVKGQEAHFVRNPSYNWAPSTASHQGPAYLDEVTYRFLSESSVRTGALSSGQVDLIEGISGNDAGLFRDDPEFRYRHALNSGTPCTLYLNTTYGPAQDVRVRRAVIAAVDVDAVLQSVYRGERTRSWGITAPIDTQLYDASIERSYGNDPNLANALLDEAGWTGRDAEGFRTKDGQRLRIEATQAQATLRDQRDVLLQALQAQLRQKAGVDLTIATVDPGTYADRTASGKFDAILNSTTPAGDGFNIEYHYLPADRGGRINYSRTAAPEVLAWLQAAAATLDRKTRFDLYARLQRFAIVEQGLGLPLYVPEDQIAAASHVHGEGFRPFHQMPENAYGIWLDR